MRKILTQVVPSPRQIGSAVDKTSGLMSNTTRISMGPVGQSAAAKWAGVIDIAGPGLQSRRVTLYKKELSIGRDESCSLNLPIPSVSRQHARFLRDSGNYVIEDTDSTNGTFVNNVRVKRCVLRNGDRVRVGQAVLTFVQEKLSDVT